MSLLRLVALVVLVMANVNASVENEEPISMKDLEDQVAGRLMKDHDPNAPAPFHEGDPSVKEKVEDDDHSPRLVKNTGPVVTKVVARGSNLSVVAWKFSNGSIRGLVEEKLDSGATTKIEVDCIKRRESEAIVGGSVVASARKDDANIKRAYVKVVDSGDGDLDRVSGISFSESEDATCDDHDFDDFQHEGTTAEVMVCSKRGGNWDECTSRIKSTA